MAERFNDILKEAVPVVRKYGVLKGTEAAQIVEDVKMLGIDGPTPARITKLLADFKLRQFEKAAPKLSEILNGVNMRFQKENRCQVTNLVYLEATGANILKGLAVGAVLAILLALVITYVVKKKQFGELYTFRDLLKDALSQLKELAKGAVESIWEQIRKLLATVIALGLVMAIFFILRKQGIFTTGSLEKWEGNNPPWWKETLGFMLRKVFSETEKGTASTDKETGMKYQMPGSIAISKAKFDALKPEKKPKPAPAAEPKAKPPKASTAGKTGERRLATAKKRQLVNKLSKSLKAHMDEEEVTENITHMTIDAIEKLLKE
jgi:hypothetical protein